MTAPSQAVERYMATRYSSSSPNAVDFMAVRASDHDAAIAALTAELQQCRQALEDALQYVPDRSEIAARIRAALANSPKESA